MMQGWPEERCALCGLRAKMNMGCKGSEPLYKRLRPCGRCKGVRYCNRECQQKHWAAHKAVCVAAGDEAAPTIKDELCALIAAGIEKKGLYVVAHSSKPTSDTPSLGDEDPVTLHTVGFHAHGAPELLVRDLPHRLVQRAAGLLTYIRCERPLNAPLAQGETLCVNGLRFVAKHLADGKLKEANDNHAVNVRGYYCLKKSDGLVKIIELVLDKDLRPPE